MISKLKSKARDFGIEPYLEKPYSLIVQNPYWFLRRRLYPKTVQNIVGFDVQFVAEDPEDISYHRFGYDEVPIINDILLEISDGDIFCDIGANIGIYSSVISQKIAADNVIAFEPSPPAYKKLQKNSRFNGNFHHYQLAVSDTDETIEFAVDVGDGVSRMSTINADSSATEYEIQEVSSRKLVTVFEEEGLPSPTIVKIDVEGAELKVLKGMGELLDSLRLIYCEIHHPVLDDFDTNGVEIIDYLESSGFKVNTLHKRGGNELVKAKRLKD